MPFSILRTLAVLALAVPAMTSPVPSPAPAVPVPSTSTTTTTTTSESIFNAVPSPIDDPAPEMKPSPDVWPDEPSPEPEPSPGPYDAPVLPPSGEPAPEVTEEPQSIPCDPTGCSGHSCEFFIHLSNAKTTYTCEVLERQHYCDCQGCACEAITAGSCANACGESLATCSCAENCAAVGDCCDDFSIICAEWEFTQAPVPAESCINACGRVFDACSCASTCQEDGNCCQDFGMICSGFDFSAVTEGPASESSTVGIIIGVGIALLVVGAVGGFFVTRSILMKNRRDRENQLLKRGNANLDTSTYASPKMNGMSGSQFNML